MDHQIHVAEVVGGVIDEQVGASGSAGLHAFVGRNAQELTLAVTDAFFNTTRTGASVRGAMRGFAAEKARGLIQEAQLVIDGMDRIRAVAEEAAYNMAVYVPQLEQDNAEAHRALEGGWLARLDARRQEHHARRLAEDIRMRDARIRTCTARRADASRMLAMLDAFDPATASVEDVQDIASEARRMGFM